VRSVKPGPAESAMGPMKKMPQRGDVQVRPRTGERRAGSYAVRNPPNDFKLFQPPHWICRAPAGSRTPRQADMQRQGKRNLNVKSLRPEVDAYPLTVLTKTTWTTYCEAA
jgi:hypothetical protein